MTIRVQTLRDCAKRQARESKVAHVRLQVGIRFDRLSLVRARLASCSSAYAIGHLRLARAWAKLGIRWA
jgi:hypothetical protein